MTRAAWFVVILVLLLALGAAGAFTYSIYSPAHEPADAG
jgi:hypothetical protein